jgi:hypothetical protein
MKADPPLYYLEHPTGLRLDFASGEVRHIGSNYLESHLRKDGKVIDLYYGTCVVRVEGENLEAIIEGLETDAPLGRLAAISERLPASQTSPGGVKVEKIAYQPRLESDFPPFDQAEEAEEENEA